MLEIKLIKLDGSLARVKVEKLAQELVIEGKLYMHDSAFPTTYFELAQLGAPAAQDDSRPKDLTLNRAHPVDNSRWGIQCRHAGKENGSK